VDFHSDVIFTTSVDVSPPKFTHILSMAIFSRQNPHFPPKIFRQKCLSRTFLARTISRQKPLLSKRPKSRSAVAVFISRQNVHSAHFPTKTWSFGGKTFRRENFDKKRRKMHIDNCIRPKCFPANMLSRQSFWAVFRQISTLRAHKLLLPSFQSQNLIWYRH